MGRPKIDLAGHTYGQLEALERAPNRGTKLVWRCRCECGAETLAMGGNLRNGHTQSCGCLHGERHGRAKTREWNAWSHIRARCENPKASNYSDYGGRGITVCQRWQSFKAFFADMGECPAGHTIERVDNDDGYHSGNCRWATRKEQANNRRTSRWIEFDGKRQTLMQWAESTGINYRTIAARIDGGWPPEAALTTDPRGQKG